MARKHLGRLTVNPRSAVCCAAVVAVILDLGGLVLSQADVPLGDTCPALYVFGVQGPDESSEDAAATTDSGALGQFFTPLSAQAGDLVQRSYIRYGYADDGTELPYEQAVSDAAGRLSTNASELLERCPATRVAAAGYGQGAAAVSSFAHDVGTGTGGIDADTVAGIALFANPTHSGSAVLPGTSGQTTPSAAPGTSGAEVAAIHLSSSAAGGSGIDSSTGVDYGRLTGRVADFCTPGDLTCDAPSGSALTQTVKNIAAQSDLRDPVAAISTIAQSLAATAWKTTVGVVTEDLSGTSLDTLSYDPKKTLGQRLTEASNPTTMMPGISEALSVLFRLGTIGLNTVVSIAQKVFTTSTISELAVVGMTDPVAALASLGTKIAGAVAELIPPQTALGWVNQAFDAISSTVTDDSDLYDLATRTEYSDTAGRHGSYTTASANSSGTPPLTLAATWFAALARDIGQVVPTASTPLTPSPAATVTSTPATLSPSYPATTLSPSRPATATSPAKTTPTTAPGTSSPRTP